MGKWKRGSATTVTTPIPQTQTSWSLLARAAYSSISEYFFGNERVRLKRKAMAMSESAREAGSAARPSEKIYPSGVFAPRAKWSAAVLQKLPNAQQLGRATQMWRVSVAEVLLDPIPRQWDRGSML